MLTLPAFALLFLFFAMVGKAHRIYTKAAINSGLVQAARSVRHRSSLVPYMNSGRTSSNLYKLPRLYLDRNLREGEQVTLSADESHYISAVMRIKPGFCFRAFNARPGQGEYLLEVSDSTNTRGRKGASVVTADVKSLLRSSEDGRENREFMPVTLYFAPIRKPKLKMILEKATELGLSKFVPVLTQNVNAKLDLVHDQSYERIIIESVEQCERIDLPKLTREALTVTALIEEWEAMKSELPLYVCRERSPSSSRLLSALLEAKVRDHSMVVVGILIGPEGGFTESELLQFAASPAVRFVSLGRNVLRAETASIAALATIMAAREHLSGTSSS